MSGMLEISVFLIKSYFFRSQCLIFVSIGWYRIRILKFTDETAYKYGFDNPNRMYVLIKRLFLRNI